MKPVRRKIRRHFGLTAKEMAIRSQRPWYFQWLLAALLLAIGFMLAYWFLNGGANAGLHQRLQQTALENQALQTKVVSLERDLQIKQALQDNLAKELTSVQDETIKIKADLIFYKNMQESKTPNKRR